MRIFGLAIAAVAAMGACKGKKDAAPAPAPGSGEPAKVVTPTKPDEPATPPPATFSQTITADGVGPVNASTDPKTVAALFPGMEARTEHSEGAGKSIDDTALAWKGGPTVLHVIADNVQKTTRVDVIGSAFATAAGIRVGATVADLLGKYPDADCRRETGPDGSALLCASPSLATLAFHLDPKALEGGDGKVPAARVASFKIVRISWQARSAAPAPAGGTAAAPGQPFCFPKNSEIVIDRIAATADAATFCWPGSGTLTCVTASLTTGAFTTAGAPPPAAPAVAPMLVSADGKQKLQRSGDSWAVTDAKTGKNTTKLSIGDKDFKCAFGAQFLGNSVYATASLCDKPRSVGFLFNAMGAALGNKIETVNVQKAKPFHLSGDRWLIRSSDSGDVLFVDVAKGTQAVTRTLSEDQVAHCCDVSVGASTSPFALTPNNKVVVVGSALAVIDLGTGESEHSWLLPGCN